MPVAPLVAAVVVAVARAVEAGQPVVGRYADLVVAVKWRIGGQGGGGYSGGGGGGFGGGGGGGGGPQGPPSAVQVALQDLQATLDNTASTADMIKAKLDALRAARSKAKEDLVAAQGDLKSILTQRQEAEMVIFGMLE